ncbi:MAG: gliding motility-associated C-terminal domain-containing protein [Bacteroidales bacterium]
MHIFKVRFGITILFLITCFYPSRAESVHKCYFNHTPCQHLTSLSTKNTSGFDPNSKIDNIFNIRTPYQPDSLYTQSICQGDSLTLTGRDNMQSYLWSNDSTTQSIRVSPTISTTYWVEMVDQNDSTFRDSTNVVVNPLPKLLSSSDDTLTIMAGTDTSLWIRVEPGATILWSNFSTDTLISISPTVNSIYSVEVSNEFGCTISKSFVVQVTYITNLEFTWDTVCENGITTMINTTLTNDSIHFVLWDLNSDGQFNDGEGDTVQYVFGAGGNHLVGMRIYFENSPMNSTYNAVPVGSKPLVDFSFENICLNSRTLFYDQTVVVSGTENQWLWQFGDGKSDRFQSTSNFYDGQGSYDVRLTVWTDMGCVDSIVKPITIIGSPEFTFRVSDSIVYNDDTVYFAEGSSLVVTANVTSAYDSIVWYDGSTDTSIRIAVFGIYSVTVYNNGCDGNARFTAIYKGNPGGGTDIMNLFTPNGDGFNDVWQVNNPDVIFPVKVNVYNRSGKSVYTSESYQNDWNGLFRGNPLPQATYYYIIQDANGNTFKGPVTIIR